MTTYANSDEAEGHEIPIHTLKVGQHFELYLSSKIKPGILLEKGSGRCTVWESEEKRRTIRTAAGAEKEVVSKGQVTWYSSGTLVVAVEKFEDTTQIKKDGTHTMAKAQKERKVKAVKEPKKLIITRYSVVASKSDTEKGKKLQDKEVTTHNAILYRAILKGGELTFDEIKTSVDKKAYGSDSKQLDANMRWHLQDLRKKGFIKSTDAKEEVAVAA